MTEAEYTELIQRCMTSAIHMKNLGQWEWVLHNELAITLRIERDGLKRVGALN